MKRALATQLAIVNWRGIFYRRYLLDRNVTALEGANGAGKTTMLIAAYVALLPDRTHLRFTNVGRHTGTASDKGIWGRLGETGRPSYTVLDIRLANGERLLAGVHIERGAEPRIALTPFLISNLPTDTKLQDLLLLHENKKASPRSKSSGSRQRGLAPGSSGVRQRRSTSRHCSTEASPH